MKRLSGFAGAVVLAVALVVPAAAASPPDYTSKTLIEGAVIHGANGLAVDHAGRVLVASVWGQEIVALDRATGAVLQRYGPVYDGVQIGGPDDVAVGPDGSIYWTDILGGRVGKIDPSGHATAKAVAPGMNPIAFTDDGRLFVGQAFFGDDLFELDPDDLTVVDTILAPSDPDFHLQLNGFDFGPDGMLYSPRPFVSQLVRIDVDSKTVEVLPDFDGVFPASVEFDADGRLFTNVGTGAVLEVDPDDGAVVDVLASLEPGLDNMVFDSKGRLFVSNSDTGGVERVIPTGSHRTVVEGGLIAPGGIAVIPAADGRDRLVIGDLWTVANVDGQTGKFLGREGRFGAAVPVEGWTVAPDGSNVIISSWMSGVVQVWDPDASEEVERHPEFGFPLNAIRFDGDLVVAVPGAVIREGTGPLPVPVGIPSGLAATADDLWVADWAAGNLWRVIRDGALDVGLLATGLAGPEGLAVDVDGSLLVVEAHAGRLTRVDATTGAKSVIAQGLAVGASPPPGAPPFFFVFNGVAVGAQGDVYVTGDVDNVVYRFSPVP